MELGFMYYFAQTYSQHFSPNGKVVLILDLKKTNKIHLTNFHKPMIYNVCFIELENAFKIQSNKKILFHENKEEVSKTCSELHELHELRICCKVL